MLNLQWKRQIIVLVFCGLIHRTYNIILQIWIIWFCFLTHRYNINFYVDNTIDLINKNHVILYFEQRNISRKLTLHMKEGDELPINLKWYHDFYTCLGTFACNCTYELKCWSRNKDEYFEERRTNAKFDGCAAGFCVFSKVQKRTCILQGNRV